MYHICHDIEIHAFANDIYALITTPEGLNSWWTVKSSGKLGVDEEYQFYFSDEYDWRGKVLELTENQSVSYFMTKADEDWDSTIVSFEIIHIDDHRYILRFEHRNWKEINKHFRRSNFCWAMYLNALKENAETKFRELSN